MKVVKGAFVRIAPRTEFRILSRPGDELSFLLRDGSSSQRATTLVALRGVILAVFDDRREVTVRVLPGDFAGGRGYPADVDRIVGERLIVASDRLSELSVVDAIAWLARR